MAPGHALIVAVADASAVPGVLWARWTYDVAPDGRRFLMIKEDAPRADRRPTQLVVVQNFFEELKRLAPVP